MVKQSPDFTANETYVPMAGMKETESYKVPNFPIETLPVKHQHIVMELNKYLAYPTDFTAAGMIAAASIASGRTHTINNGIWEDGACFCASRSSWEIFSGSLLNSLWLWKIGRAHV